MDAYVASGPRYRAWVGFSLYYGLFQVSFYPRSRGSLRESWGAEFKEVM